MTQEIKDKLEQAAKDYIDKWPVKFTAAESSAFFAGAKAILENPSEWGLIAKRDVLSDIESLELEHKFVLSQLTKYREALEKLLEENMCSHAGDELIEEALKQEEE